MAVAETYLEASSERVLKKLRYVGSRCKVCFDTHRLGMFFSLPPHFDNILTLTFPKVNWQWSDFDSAISIRFVHFDEPCKTPGNLGKSLGKFPEISKLLPVFSTVLRTYFKLFRGGTQEDFQKNSPSSGEKRPSPAKHPANPAFANGFPVSPSEKRGLPRGNLFSLALLGERECHAPKGYSVSPSLALPRAFTNPGRGALVSYEKPERGLPHGKPLLSRVIRGSGNGTLPKVTVSPPAWLCPGPSPPPGGGVGGCQDTRSFTSTGPRR